MKQIILFIISLTCGVVVAQQPRMPQVDEYREATGEVRRLGEVVGESSRYNLLGTLACDGKNFLLDLPKIDDKGTREVMPFGYRLNALSQIDLVEVAGNMAQSDKRMLYNKSRFSEVDYLLCDSVVYGIRLYFDAKSSEVKDFVVAQCKGFFGDADFSSDTLTVFSDSDYLVKIHEGEVETYSLYHYPGEELRFPGVQLFKWEAPCRVVAGNAAISLSFYNQRTKENNMQLAFELGIEATESFGMKKISFVADGKSYEYDVKSDFTDKAIDKRTFMFPEDVKHILRSHTLTVTIEGDNGKHISYEMPEYQRASLFTAFTYFRWNVTNPMMKYRGW